MVPDRQILMVVLVIETSQRFSTALRFDRSWCLLSGGHAPPVPMGSPEAERSPTAHTDEPKLAPDLHMSRVRPPPRTKDGST